ncbi:MAG: phenylalanine--tRNA ligase subunit alpha [Candidatus Korarchaeota archaeon]|nr:phenylalanine--tRNA ligase subunit alpha [Thermoproteota archaeon]MCR8471471.1 phenylalanine--tRNA ligase subunit alpha [Thermoproteota archaeon]MCR8473314.1 phenylalanine--tRNA ligase subunit alpha [Thermoproteota archaeon]MCR8488070.1 phenylalanine--tRNA ligase subunit alpha [Thermoproteota archaeon]
MQVDSKIKEIIYSMTNGERKLLRLLAKSNKKSLDVNSIVSESGLAEAEVNRVVMWLENKGIVKRKPIEVKVFVPTKKALLYEKELLPETRLLNILKTVKRIPLSSIVNHGFTSEEASAAVGLLLRMGLAKVLKEKEEKYLVSTLEAESVAKLGTEECLRKLLAEREIPAEERSPELELLVDRGLAKLETRTIWVIEITDLGDKILSQGIPEIDFIEQLTPEVIASRAWYQRPIRWYDVEAWSPKIWGGRKNPLKILADKVREIFVSMGFKEMRSPWVDMEFWCFDSMWIPQDHPAREMQSTYWLAQPKEGKLPDEELVNEVKKVQENGGNTGSTGWRLPWDVKIAKRCILRTHTTASTFRVLGYLIKTGKIKPPVKFFAIGRVFRNETIDWKHLCEFHQIEGFVIAPNLTLRSLMGYIKEFYSRMGIKKIRFKPTYNPYTEPSMEIFTWHEKTGRWVEIGNSGMFRPEALAPYNVRWPTIAWGLALERLAMIIWNIEDIRKLLGHGVNIDWLRYYNYPAIESK